MAVIFQEETQPTARVVVPAKQSFMSKLVIASGLAKTVAQAEQVMLLLAIGGLILTIVIVFMTNFQQPAASQSEFAAANAKLQMEQDGK